MTIIQRIETHGCGCGAAGPTDALIGIDEAFARIARDAAPINGTETVSLSGAHGRVLAEPVRAMSMSPDFDNAAMDGYAVDAAAFSGNGPWAFSVEDRVPAGAPALAAVSPDRVARIFTGAPVPSGATAVIPQENAHRAGDRVTFAKRPLPGSNIRRAGAEMQTGDVILDGGAVLGPRQVAACAAAGAVHVQVRRALRVALLVTGDEVRASGEGRDAAEIWDVNTPMLRAALGGAAQDLVHVGHVGDRRDLVERKLADLARQVDLIVTTGGISVGEEDHVKPALAEIGGEIRFSGVAIKPGKPVSFGRIGACSWLGLPGNPLSAFVTWQLFGKELVDNLTGAISRRNARRHVTTATVIQRKPGRCELRPANVIGFDSSGREIVAFEDQTHSARVTRLSGADGLMLLPAESDHLPAGAIVEFIPLCDT